MNSTCQKLSYTYRLKITNSRRRFNEQTRQSSIIDYRCLTSIMFARIITINCFQIRHTDDDTFIRIRRTYVATLVSQRESTFYFDEPSGRDSRLGQRLHRIVFFLSRYPREPIYLFSYALRHPWDASRRSLDKTRIRRRRRKRLAVSQQPNEERRKSEHTGNCNLPRKLYTQKNTNWVLCSSSRPFYVLLFDIPNIKIHRLK